MKGGRPIRVVQVDATGRSLGAYLFACRVMANGKPSQRQVAEKIGVSRVAISDYERDIYQPSPESLAQMLSLYGVEPSSFPFAVPVAAPYRPHRIHSDSTEGGVAIVTFEIGGDHYFLSDAIRQMSAVDDLLKRCGGENTDVQILSISASDRDLRLTVRTVEVAA